MAVPVAPKLYHIIHVDRVASIVADGFLWSDSKSAQRQSPGTAIGMDTIKKRRLDELTLDSHPELHVGECVPFYFCPRSIMLYLIYRANHPNLVFRDGQSSIVHLELDMHSVVRWATTENHRWAFTLSNAGARYFEDRSDLDCLHEIDWEAIDARDWQRCQEGKQAEFLVENECNWELITRIGTATPEIRSQVSAAIAGAAHTPVVEVRTDWYY